VALDVPPFFYIFNLSVLQLASPRATTAPPARAELCNKKERNTRKAYPNCTGGLDEPSKALFQVTRHFVT